MLTQSILVIGDYPQTLAVVRSLGRAGYQVLLTHDQPRAIAAHSKYCSEYWQCSAYQSKAFEREVVRYMEKNSNIVAIYPIGIAAIRALGLLKTDRVISQVTACVNPQVLEIFDDKISANTIASTAGVQVPRSAVVSDLVELRRTVLEMGFPVIVKSPSNAGAVLGRKALILNCSTELEEFFERWPSQHNTLMVQRYITGRMYACDFVAKDGQIVAYYEGAGDETDAADGTGFVVRFRALTPTVKLFEALRKLVAETNYSGPGLLQCILSDNDGECYFVEINPRLSAGIAEVVNADLDLPLINLTSALNNPPRALEGPGDAIYNKDSQTYWLERDFHGVLKSRHEMSLFQFGSWFIGMVGKLLTCDGHVNWSWRDPIPSVWIVSRFLRRASKINNG